MRASLRFGTKLLAGAMSLLPVPALAQNTTQPPATNTPAPETVGPRELQNFSLSGTATRPSEQPAVSATTAPTRSAQPPRSAPAPARRTAQIRQPLRETATTSPPPTREAQPPAPISVALPSSTNSVTASAPQPAPITSTPSQPAAPAATLATEHKLSILPWLVAGLALAAATIFLFWRRRPREAFAGPQFDLFAPPEPTPAPTPPAIAPRAVPEPPKPPAPAATGIVAARLRPSLEIGVHPLRCLVADDRVTIEFELELFNAGTAPARAVLAEASLLNAGATQDQELAAFFASPVGAGQRMDAIPPMQRITLASQVVAPRAAVQEYELGGRKAFVPVLAFNALYEWSGGKAQTSAAYLVGRETKGNKLGPLRLDLGPREFSGLGTRALPTALRT